MCLQYADTHCVFFVEAVDSAWCAVVLLLRSRKMLIDDVLPQ